MISFWIRMKIAQVKNFYHEQLPWWIAWHLPRKITLYCFVRVYAVLGDCGDDYNNAYQMWARGIGK